MKTKKGKETMRTVEVKYELVDCDGLATLLAEDAWTEEMKIKGSGKQQLYEKDRVTIRSEFEPLFSKLRNAYYRLIEIHKKPTNICSLQNVQKT